MSIKMVLAFAQPLRIQIVFLYLFSFLNVVNSEKAVSARQDKSSIV